MLAQEQIETIKNFLIEHLSPDVIYIFGSAAKDNMRPDSDIDIAFLSDTTHDAYDIFMLAQKLASLLHRDIDLVDLNRASTVFQMQVVSTGQVIYSKDEKKRILFETYVYKEYATLCEDREPIIKRIKHDGSIYGNGKIYESGDIYGK